MPVVQTKGLKLGPDSRVVINCSQTKFVTIMLVLLVFFNAILSALRAFQLISFQVCDSETVLQTYTYGMTGSS